MEQPNTVTNTLSDQVKRIYIHEMLLNVFIYLGWTKGYTTVSESMQDPVIREYARLSFEEAVGGIKQEYVLSENAIESWGQSLLNSVANLCPDDRISGGTVQPEQAIRRTGPLTGAALLCRRHGNHPYFLIKSIASVFNFIQRSTIGPGLIIDDIKQASMKDVIRTYCGVLRESGLAESIYRQYQTAVEGKLFEDDMNRALVLKRAYRLGFEKERIFKGCAQCHLLAQFDLTGENNESLFMAASALAAGIGRCGDGSCGAYTGGVLFMGSTIGRRLECVDNDRDNWNTSYEMTQQLQERFIRAYGTVTCMHIHEDIFGKAYILKDTSVRDAFEKAGAHTDKCTTVVAYAVMWVAEILIEQGYLVPQEGGEVLWNPPKL